MLVFGTWCSVAGRQKINVNVFFNAIWFILLKERTQCQNQFSNHSYMILSCSEDRSLCSRRSSFITSDLIGLPRLCPCCLCLCWALTAYLSRLLGGRALPHPPPPSWPHFPQIPGNSLFPHRAQLGPSGSYESNVQWLAGEAAFLGNSSYQEWSVQSRCNLQRCYNIMS